MSNASILKVYFPILQLATHIMSHGKFQRCGMKRRLKNSNNLFRSNFDASREKEFRIFAYLSAEDS